MSALVMALLASALGARPWAAGGPVPFGSAEDVAAFAGRYYQDPQPERVLPSLEYLARVSGVPEDDTAERSGLVAFYAAIFRRDPGLPLAGLRDALSRNDSSSEFLWEVLWFAGTPATRSFLETVGPPSGSAPGRRERWDMLCRTPSPDLMTMEASGPGGIAALWGSYFATGDARFVERVIASLALARSPHDAAKIRTGTSAQVSLITNARLHPKVLEICKARLTKEPKAVRKVLEEIVARAVAP